MAHAVPCNLQVLQPPTDSTDDPVKKGSTIIVAYEGEEAMVLVHISCDDKREFLTRP